MSDMAKKIEDHLRERIRIASLEVINESHLHIGHSGDNGTGQTHFKLKVVSNDFDGLNRVQSQRLVLGCLKPLFSSGLHAVSVFTSKA